MPKIVVKRFELCGYDRVLVKMRNFTNHRRSNTADEIWFVQHHSVYTEGTKKNNTISTNLSTTKSDRGGGITFHGPGQQIVYFLFDLKRKRLKIKRFIFLICTAVSETLLHFGIVSQFGVAFPGIYVQNRKICSLGLKIQNGCSSHGIALNVNMDLSPFDRILPCGIPWLKMTQMNRFVPTITTADVVPVLIRNFVRAFSTENSSRFDSSASNTRIFRRTPSEIRQPC